MPRALRHPPGPSVTGVSEDLRHRLGSHGEQLAADHLERLGLRVIDRNYRTRHGELDLVAYDGHRLVFCEVKTRRTGPGRPWDALGDAKQSRVRAMASQWLRERPGRPGATELRFDAIGVTIDPRGRLAGLEHLEAAF